MYQKKILALAVTSVFAGTAYAVAPTAINMDSAATQAITLASETTRPLIANGLAVNGQTGWGFSSGTAVYVRYDLGGSGTFVTSPTAMTANNADGTSQPDANASATLSTGGAGGSNVIYQITSANSLFTTTTANLQLVLASNSIQNASTLTQSIYDTSANAVAGGTAGRLTTKTVTIVSYLPSYTFSVTPGTAQTSDATATRGIYKSFTGAISTDTAALGTISIANAAATVLGNSNASATANMVMTTASYLNVTGDFTAAVSANGVYDSTAKARVFLSNSACSQAASSFINANNVTATTATFVLSGATQGTASLPGNNTLCLTTEGNSAIAAATYTAQFIPKAQSGYTVSSSPVYAIGSVTRNGGQLTSPWFSTAPGYVSRFILTNTSSAAASYTVSVVTETGNTATTVPAALSGSVPANGMVAINATDIVSAFSGATRGAVTFTFQTGRANINGTYQIVNTTSGGISNTVMVAPGTN